MGSGPLDGAIIELAMGKQSPRLLRNQLFEPEAVGLWVRTTGTQGSVKSSSSHPAILSAPRAGWDGPSRISGNCVEKVAARRAKMYGSGHRGWEMGVSTVGKNLFLGAGECLGNVFSLFIAGEPDKLVNGDLL